MERARSCTSVSGFRVQFLFLTIGVLCFLVSVSVSASGIPDTVRSPETVAASGNRLLRRHRFCDSVLSRQNLHSVPVRRQKLILRHCWPLAPPPPPVEDGHEIDPRYGVEKRLIPSGPNPLHN